MHLACVLACRNRFRFTFCCSNFMAQIDTNELRKQALELIEDKENLFTDYGFYFSSHVSVMVTNKNVASVEEASLGDLMVKCVYYVPDYIEKGIRVNDLKSVIEWPEMRKKWDVNFGSGSLVEALNENTILGHVKTRSVFPIASREMLCILHSCNDFTKNGQDIWLSLSKSIALASAGKLAKFDYRSVEATLELGCFAVDIVPTSDIPTVHKERQPILAQRERVLRLTNLLQTDPCGNLGGVAKILIKRLLPSAFSLILKEVTSAGSPPYVQSLMWSKPWPCEVPIKNFKYDPSTKLFYMGFEYDLLQGNLFEGNESVEVVLRIDTLRWCRNANVNIIIEETGLKAKFYAMRKVGELFLKMVHYSITPSSKLCLKLSCVNKTSTDSDRTEIIINNGHIKVEPWVEHAETTSEESEKFESTVLETSLSTEHDSPFRKYMLETCSALEQIKKLSNKFIAVAEHNPISVSKIPVANHPTGIIKGTARYFSKIDSRVYIDNLQAVIETSGARAVWDYMFDGGELLYTFPSMKQDYATYESKIVHTLTKGQWPIAGRDVIVCLVSKKPTTEWNPVELYSKSVPNDLENELPKFKLPSAHLVRATLEAGMWILVPNEGSVEITYVVQTHPNGDIPSSLLQRVANHFPMCIQKVVDYEAKYGFPPHVVSSNGVQIFSSNYFHMKKLVLAADFRSSQSWLELRIDIKHWKSIELDASHGVICFWWKDTSTSITMRLFSEGSANIAVVNKTVSLQDSFSMAGGNGKMQELRNNDIFVKARGRHVLKDDPNIFTVLVHEKSDKKTLKSVDSVPPYFEKLMGEYRDLMDVLNDEWIEVKPNIYESGSYIKHSFKVGYMTPEDCVNVTPCFESSMKLWLHSDLNDFKWSSFGVAEIRSTVNYAFGPSRQLLSHLLVKRFKIGLNIKGMRLESHKILVALAIEKDANSLLPFETLGILLEPSYCGLKSASSLPAGFTIIPHTKFSLILRKGVDTSNKAAINYVLDILPRLKLSLKDTSGFAPVVRSCSLSPRSGETIMFEKEMKCCNVVGSRTQNGYYYKMMISHSQKRLVASRLNKVEYVKLLSLSIPVENKIWNNGYDVILDGATPQISSFCFMGKDEQEVSFFGPVIPGQNAQIRKREVISLFVSQNMLLERHSKRQEDIVISVTIQWRKVLDLNRAIYLNGAPMPTVESFFVETELSTGIKPKRSRMIVLFGFIILLLIIVCLIIL